MRITNNIIHRDSLAYVQANARGISKAQQQVSTGLRVTKPSDDPSVAAAAMQAGGSLRAITQYRRNIESATGRAAAEEGVLDRLSETLTRAKELGVAQGTATASAATRLVAKSEVDQILASALSLGNTQYAGEYLFGGKRVDLAPFDASRAGFVAADPADSSGTTSLDLTGAPATEIAAGQRVRATHDGAQVFTTAGRSPLAALKQLSDALGANDQNAVRASIAALDGAFDGTQGLLSETGGRTNQLQMAQSNLDALEGTLKTFKSNLEEVDLEKAMTELVGKQTAYQAAMLATSKVLSLNLTDYLR